MEDNYAKPWQLEDNPEKAIIAALKEIAEVYSVEDEPLSGIRVFRIRFKPEYNSQRYYASGSIE